MIKRTVTYTDLNTGKEKKEDLYFHLNKAELVRLTGRKNNGDFEGYIKEVTDSGDVDSILDVLEEVLKMAYGERSEDGRTFHKSKQAQEDFIQSEAYSELFVSFFKDLDSSNPSDSLEAFFKGVVGDNGSAKEGAKSKK